jgi:hypothetical protein
VDVSSHIAKSWSVPPDFKAIGYIRANWYSRYTANNIELPSVSRKFNPTKHEKEKPGCFAEQNALTIRYANGDFLLF